MVFLKSIQAIGLGKLRVQKIVLTGEINSVVSLRTVAVLMSTKAASRLSISKALELVTVTPVKLTPGPPPILLSDHPRPLVIMLAWMLAKKKHLHKYCDFYLRRGCDILTVQISPWQTLWPAKGSQLIAEEVLQFLEKNNMCQPLLLHGFSVGAYVWGEVLVKMNKDKERYQGITNRIVGQTWDSATDVSELHVGLPLAVFPRNPILRMALSKYIDYHLKAYKDDATTHYLRASQMFHTDPVPCPALLLLSKADPVGSIKANLRAKETWESIGIKVNWKCWDDSKHVSHFVKYKNEYIEVLEKFLNTLEEKSKNGKIENDKNNSMVKIQAKLC